MTTSHAPHLQAQRAEKQAPRVSKHPDDRTYRCFHTTPALATLHALCDVTSVRSSQDTGPAWLFRIRGGFLHSRLRAPHVAVFPDNVRLHPKRCLRAGKAPASIPGGTPWTPLPSYQPHRIEYIRSVKTWEEKGPGVCHSPLLTPHNTHTEFFL